MTEMTDAQREIERAKPEDTDFRQQRLRAWQPILTPRWIVIIFVVIGIIFIPIGAALLVATADVVEVETRYDETCGTAPECTVTVDIPKKMSGPVYFYYKLTNFFQNHRRYVKSRSDTQLSGDGGSTSSCDPLEDFNAGSGAKTLYPCGLVANSYFNDAYVGEYQLMQADGTLAAPVTLSGDNWDQTDIAWKTDIETKYRDIYAPVTATPLPDDLTRVGPRGQLPYLDDQHLMNWMRTAALSKFRKLYAVIDRGFPAGSRLTFNVTNNYDVAGFDGTKSVFLSTVSWAGGKNNFLGWAYIGVGIACFVLAAAFAIKAAVAPRPLGDLKYFTRPERA
jgi:hypothetical protein